MMETRHQERETDTKSREERIDRERTSLKNDLQSAQLQIKRLRRKLEEREIEIDKIRSTTVFSTEGSLTRSFDFSIGR